MSKIKCRGVRVGRRHVLMVVASAATGALVFTAWASASPRRAAVTSPPKDVLAETSSNTNLSTVGGQETTVISMTLPAGSWVITSEDTLVNFGPSDYFRCAIQAPGTTQIASGSSMVGDPNLSGAQGPGVYVAGRGLVGSLKSTSSFTASLVCSHDNNTPSGNGPPYVDAGAVMWAHVSQGLSGTTH